MVIPETPLEGPVFAILAAILFGLALLLDLINEGNDVLNPGTLTTAGLLCVALHLSGMATALRGRRWGSRR
jgi:hypothetical protein